MAKVKLTKTELKTQSDALKRFQRFLPMLQLKKQQLQAELSAISAKIDALKAQETQAHADLDNWVSLFSMQEISAQMLIKINRIETETSNIAGVTIPVFKQLDVTRAELDLFATSAWLDDATTMLLKLLTFKAQRLILEKQYELIHIELNTTSQRVNLFEKIKIPACRETIRLIKIAIGDEQTASVTRGKIAKSRNRQNNNEENAA